MSPHPITSSPPHLLTPSVAAAAALALGVLALLWPEERGTAAGRVRAGLFAALAAVVGFVLAGVQADRAGGAAMARAFEAYTRGMIDARQAEADAWFAPSYAPTTRRPPAHPPAELRRRALRSYAEAVRRAPEATLFRRQYAILLADAGHGSEALSQFRQVVRIAAGRRLPPRGEIQLWERLYATPPPRPAELPGLEARLRQLHLGWFAYLVRRSVYQRMGWQRQAEAVSEAAGREALLLLLTISALVIVTLGAALVGLILLVAALVGWRSGRFHPVPAEMRAGAAPLLEAFVLYLFLSVAPALPRLAGRAPRWLAPDRSTTLTVALWLGSDLLALVALVYLRVRLRARGLTLAEIGLHGRELGRNIRYGLGGYLAALPLVFGSSLLASWVGHRYFPQVAPPFHPIQAMTAATSSGWVRFALLIVAAVAAPILEETFFRGLLYGALRRRFGVAAGIVASAAVFSSLHPQLPLGFLPIFVLGAVFAGLYEWRQSLVPGMVMHAVNNGLIWIYLNLLFPPG